MISMLIADRQEDEGTIVYRTARELAGRLTEEQWQFLRLNNAAGLSVYRHKSIPLDLICIDVGMAEAIPVLEQIRVNNSHAFIIIVADPELSPASYIKPGIMAAALMMRPLDQRTIADVLKDTFTIFIKRFYKIREETKQVFIIENREGRMVIDRRQIFYFEAREKKIFLNTINKEISFYETLDHLEEQFEEELLRCHRSFLVNPVKIEKILLSQNLICLEGGYQIPVSRSYKKKVKEYRI